MSYKKVPWEDYSKAFRDVCRKMSEYSECRVHIVERGGTLDDPPIHLSVSWPSIGAVEPEEAKAFSDAIAFAAKLSSEFPYNGYVIEWQT